MLGYWWTLAFGDLFLHFLSSGLAGLLATCLTWITYSYSLLRESPLPSRTFLQTQEGRFILRQSLLAGVFFSLAMHWAIDYYPVVLKRLGN